MSDKNGKADAKKPEEAAAESPAEQGAPQFPGATPRVVWDDSNMSSSFANVVNVLATREEMTLLFGTNQTWNAAGSEELVVQLSERIVLSPYAAKRLSLLLDRRVQEYEQLFGKLDV